MFRASYWGSGARVPPYLFSTLFTSLLISASDGIYYCIPLFLIGAPFCIGLGLSSFSFVWIFLLILLIYDTESSKTVEGLFSSICVPFDSFDFFRPSDIMMCLLPVLFESSSARSQLPLRFYRDSSSLSFISLSLIAIIFSSS